MNVLIVDDEKEIVSLLEQDIESSFMCHVDVAYNGLDAFILCQQNKYDLIITDYEMPMMKGSGLIIAVKTRENLNKQTPIMLVTAYSTEGLEQIPQLKDVKFVKKPFSFKDLHKTIEGLLA